MERRDANLDGLLARGRLSGPQRERVFYRLRRSVQGVSPVLGRLAIGVPLAAAAALFLFLFLFQLRAPGHDQFSVKGNAGGHVEVDCDGASLSACPVGSTLIFRLADIARPAYVHAYAEPTSPNGERIWYFPAAGQSPPSVAATAGQEVLRNAIVVGPEHVPGRYRLHVLLSTRPLDRGAVLRPDSNVVVDKTVIDWEVVAR